MNLYHVQQCDTWKHASKACRSEFIEAMRKLEYGASETKDAWDWFVMGWTGGVKDAFTGEISIARSPVGS